MNDGTHIKPGEQLQAEKRRLRSALLEVLEIEGQPWRSRWSTKPQAMNHKLSQIEQTARHALRELEAEGH